MPTYEYVCEACDHAFEEFQSISAKPLRKCPKCGKSRLKRLIGTGAGVIFKGSGFYQTDYRSESYKKAAKAETESASSASKSSDKAVESGSASSSTTKESAPAKTEPAPKSKPAKKND